MSTCSTRTEDPARALWRARLTAPTPIPAHEFDPPPEPAEKILADVCNPDLALGDIAHKANTSFESLALWLARPDIAARLDAIESMIRRRLRLSALVSANSVLVACSTVMERFSRAPDRGPEDYKDPTTHAIHTRNAANALMAARIHLYTLKLLTQPPRSPKPTTPTPNPAPTPAPAPAPGSDSGPNPNPNHNPTLPTSTPSRIRLFPNLSDLDPTLNDPHAEPTTTPASNPARDNAHHAPASTSPSRKRRPDPSVPSQHSAPAPQPEEPTANGPAHDPRPESVQLSIAPAKTPCACHANPTTPSPCGPCSSAARSPTTILTTAGTTTPLTPRARDPTTSQR